MPGHVVFVRFFVGYTPQFPFDQFDSLSDDAVAAEAEALRGEWWTDPDNRKRFGGWYEQQRRQQVLANAMAGRGRPTPPASVQQLQFIDVFFPSGSRDGGSTPGFLDIASAAGWRRAEADDYAFPPYCISGRYPLAKYDDKRDADDAATALQTRAAEAFRGAEAATDTGEVTVMLPNGRTISRIGGRDDRSVTLHQAGPRYTVAAEADLPRHERVNAHERIKRLSSPPDVPPDPTERLVRAFWPGFRPVLDHLHAARDSSGSFGPPAADLANGPRPQARGKVKTSTERGGSRKKLIAALTKYHKYADGGCLNPDPIGSNDLAELAGVGTGSASRFFKAKFKGHENYVLMCGDKDRLIAALKLLNDEFTPYLLSKPLRDEGRRDGY